jgi:hypothetical protein
MANPNDVVNYNFANAPNPSGHPGDVLNPEQLRYHNMAELRQALNNKDSRDISRLIQQRAVERKDVNLDAITDPLFKENVVRLFYSNGTGGRRRKSRKTRRRRHGRKTRRMR